MAKYNDIDMKKWKEYGDILTETLWIFDKRDNSGMHKGNYHGNFVPQIPNQLFRRYTKKGDWILDPFAGGGTSLIEAKNLERNSIGIELSKETISLIDESVFNEEDNPVCKIVNGDSKTIDVEKILSKENINKVQFVIFHPPYWDIIKFTDHKDDLSNTETIDEFLDSFEKVIDNTCKVLEKNRYCALVMGDKYANSEIVPLGYHCMNLFLKKEYKLKAILVKNFEETKGKANQKSLWRYRALSSDFFIFKHEYIFIFKKVR